MNPDAEFGCFPLNGFSDRVHWIAPALLHRRFRPDPAPWCWLFVGFPPHQTPKESTMRNSRRQRQGGNQGGWNQSGQGWNQQRNLAQG